MSPLVHKIATMTPENDTVAFPEDAQIIWIAGPVW